MTISALTGWIGLGLVPLAALTGWFLRRFAKGGFIHRMRPHVILGYGALGFALVHLTLTLGGLAGTNTTGIWLASLATFGLALQALSGSNLQSPGAYRLVLRRWHIVLFCVTLVLIFGHVLMNAAFIPQEAVSFCGEIPTAT